MFSIITGRRPPKNLVVWGLFCAASAVGAGACDKVPLLAPNLSTVTLSTNSSVVQANGTAQISATVLESSGTPVQNGTTVTFSTNLGTVSPGDARTMNGVATTQFSANGQSGVAEIRATSGAAKPSDTTNPTLKITIGSAAASRVQVTANPNRLGAGGGTSAITAVVTDTNGNPLGGIAVSFSTDVGNLSNSAITTNGSGLAVTSLTTSKDATVTATAGLAATTLGTVKVTVGVLPDISITVASGSTLVQGQPVTFTVGVTAATSTDSFTSVIVNFGDGTSSPNLGTSATASVQHVYNSAGTFTVTAIGTSASGDSKPAATVIVIQPMLVSLSATKSGTTVTFTATVTPAGTAVSNYFWDFGDNTNTNTSTNSTSRTYPAGVCSAAAPCGARVTITGANGQTASSPTTTVTIP